MRLSSLPLAALLPLFLCSGCEQKKDPPASEKEGAAEAEEGPGEVTVDKATLAVFAPLPPGWSKDGASPALVELGKKLYYEHRLSKSHELSCNSCHVLDKFGVDNQPTSPGHKGQRGERNSPTVYNAAGHVAQFWDGRAKDVEEQALGPILNPVEMALKDEDTAVKTLKSMPEYVKAFEEAFPKQKDPVTFANIGAAIGAFERKLSTPSAFDKFLNGDKGALTDEEKKGLKTFVSVGCTTCHNGPLVGGAMYQKLGLVKPWPELEDKGRGGVTGNEAESYFFKVPSLRNVEKTGPYFHDGETAELSEAVKLMATHQLGKELSDEQVKEIVAFLGSLTGELPKELIKKPTLPESTDKTPKPDPS